MTFLVSDGVIPSNEGRGYVLRRLIRRAARHGKLLGIQHGFLTDVVQVVIESWKIEYPEIKDREEDIKRIIKAEEEKFEETIHQGIAILEGYIHEMKLQNQDSLSGENAFKLYDTYGFPLDLTKEILEEKSLLIDEAGFNEHMEAQRDRARRAREEGHSGWTTEVGSDLFAGLETEFLGYNKTNITSDIIAQNSFYNSLLVNYIHYY